MLTHTVSWGVAPRLQVTSGELAAAIAGSAGSMDASTAKAAAGLVVKNSTIRTAISMAEGDGKGGDFCAAVRNGQV